MSRRLGRRLCRASAVGLALYAVFLLTSPFQHTDRLCRATFHCTACSSTVPGSDPNPPAIFDAGHLLDAGRVTTEVVLASGALLPVRSTGRSPPAA